MGVLSWRGLVIPKLSAPPSGETMHQTPESFWRCKNVLEVLYHHAKFGGARISSAAGATKNGATKNVEFVCLSVCTSRFWRLEIVRPISPWRRWSTEMILMPLDRGRFVVVHPCSTFSDGCQLATPLNAEVQNMAKIVFFCRQRATE